MKQEIDGYNYDDAGLIEEVFYLISDDRAAEALEIWKKAREENPLPGGEFIEGVILSKIADAVEKARELLWASYDGDDASFLKSLHWMEFVGSHCSPHDARIFLERKIIEWGQESVKSLVLQSCFSLFEEDITEYLRLTRLALEGELHPEDSRWIYMHACGVISGEKIFEENEDLIKNALYLFPTETPFVVTWLGLLMAKKEYSQLAELAVTEADSILPGELRLSMAAILMEQEQYELAQVYLNKIEEGELTGPSKVNLFILCSKSLQQLNVYKEHRNGTELEKLKNTLSEWKYLLDIHDGDEEMEKLSVTHRRMVNSIADQLEISL